MYYFLGTSPRVIFRKRAVLFGVKGKGMGISGYSIPPLEKHSAAGQNVYTHILFCLCVCFVWDRIEKLERKREKREETETSQRAKGGVWWSSDPLAVWHQGPVLWKTIFPWTDWEWFGDDSSALHLLCILFLLLLHQLHLRSSGIRPWRLGTSMKLFSDAYLRRPLLTVISL